MAIKKILTKTQEKFLEFFKKKPLLYNRFILSGGTALAGFYCLHRYSEDLDFFSKEEVDAQGIFALMHAFIKPLGFKKIEFEQSFNRNLFFFLGPKETLKTEFTYFPFEEISKGKTMGNLRIDSLKDISVNKVFTIYQKPRMRDFIDLFIILSHKSWSIRSLTKLAQIKFDTYLDPLQWGSRLLEVRTLKDYPRLITKLNVEKMEKFFVNEALAQKANILKE